MRLLLILAALCFSPQLFAQVNISTATNQKQYLSYEPVKVIVAITNQAGGQLDLQNDGNKKWIEFVVRNQSGNIVHKHQDSAYAGTSIPMNETIKSTFILNNSFDISQPGNYSVSTIIRTPNQSASEGTKSAPTFFTVNRGVPTWKTKVGVPGEAGSEREYRLIKHTGNTSPNIYVQVEDTKRGVVLATYTMGKILTFGALDKAIDSANNLHVLFLTTPELYCHTVVAPSGKTILRNYYKAIGNGRPALVTTSLSEIAVAGATLYDPVQEQEERNKFHNLSELPSGL